MRLLRVAAVLLTCATFGNAVSQTREEWIALGTHIHGGFGVLIPIGIRIGLDGRERLKAEPRDLSAVFHVGLKAPCPCIADGVMIAARVSPGQGTLSVAAEKAAEGLYAVVVVRNRKTGEGLRYSISDAWIPKIIEWNRTLDPAGRYDAAMGAQGLFEVQRISN